MALVYTANQSYIVRPCLKTKIKEKRREKEVDCRAGEEKPWGPEKQLSG